MSTSATDAWNWARFIAIVMLFAAFLPLPYGYFMLLRLVVTVVAIWSLVCCMNLDEGGWAMGFGILALVFNPVFPIHLDRGLWSVIDVISAIFIWASMVSLKDKADASVTE